MGFFFGGGGSSGLSSPTSGPVMLSFYYGDIMALCSHANTKMMS